MKISFHGAARTVTGSKHIIQLNDGRKILLDCGMFQGMGKETMQLNHTWGFEPKSLSCVIISHAHIDHTGLLPRLVKDGYQGPIYCTKATADLMRILLEDSAHIQEADIRYVNKQRSKSGRNNLEEPLYTVEDVEAVFHLLHVVDYDRNIQVDSGIELYYTDCGHILGSAAVNLILQENGKSTRITFSGDVGRYRDIILRSPQRFPQADYIIMESTYGDKLHPPVAESQDFLLAQIEKICLQQKGKLIIPAFSVGRSQEILFLLNRLELEHRLPKLPYYVDSPLTAKATTVMREHPECFNKTVQDILHHDDDVFGFQGLAFIHDVAESIALNDYPHPCVIISASGMAEAGRVKHHIAHAISDERNGILLTGYCEPQSLGARLQEGRDEVGIFGRPYPVRASVAAMHSLSAHGDYEDLSQWLACQDPKQVQRLFLVHGEYEVQIHFAERLRKKGFKDVEIPAMHEHFRLE
ncbi:MAG: MBL fold metallo-hydrolase [Bacteroidetes bacterium]|nr:MBL fold metallo-hydrolase [Bacteroidota bacterium]MBS1629485.1 MBL fold metallo-hydrolase [Bacteroidota bacterium]